MTSLENLEKNVVIINGSAAAVVGLLLFSLTIVPLAQGATDRNCTSIECLKEELKRICETDPKPEYLDCENILRCIDGGEQEVMNCAKGYPAGFE